jgi:hypothetical protein
MIAVGGDIASSRKQGAAHPKLDRARLTEKVDHEAGHATIVSIQAMPPMQDSLPHEGLLALNNLSFDHFGGIVEMRFGIEWRGCCDAVLMMEKVAKKIGNEEFCRKEGKEALSCAKSDLASAFSARTTQIFEAGEFSCSSGAGLCLGNQKFGRRKCLFRGLTGTPEAQMPHYFMFTLLSQVAMPSSRHRQ